MTTFRVRVTSTTAAGLVSKLRLTAQQSQRNPQDRPQWRRDPDDPDACLIEADSPSQVHAYLNSGSFTWHDADMTDIAIDPAE